MIPPLPKFFSKKKRQNSHGVNLVRLVKDGLITFKDLETLKWCQYMSLVRLINIIYDEENKANKRGK